MRGSEEAEGLAASQHEHMNPVYLAVHSHVVTSSLSPLTVFALKFDQLCNLKLDEVLLIDQRCPIHVPQLYAWQVFEIERDENGRVQCRNLYQVIHRSRMSSFFQCLVRRPSSPSIFMYSRSRAFTQSLCQFFHQHIIGANLHLAPGKRQYIGENGYLDPSCSLHYSLNLRSSDIMW